MKILKLIVIGILLFLGSEAQAQVSVNVNIGTPPPWGPVGYTEVRYYYLPDVEAYYDVQSSMFIYFGGGVWVHRTYLPSRYRSYDLYSGYKVVMTDYRGDAPYSNFNEYKTKYAKGYRGEAQRTIGERPGKRNSGEKMIAKDRSNKRVSRGSSKSVGHEINNGGAHGNDKNMKANHGHNGNNAKKK